jgi:predicted chitinase
MDNLSRAAVGIGPQTLKAIAPSFLKRTTGQASTLESDQKIQVITGFEIAVDNCKMFNGHYEFDSSDVRFLGRGYAFAGHFELLGEIESKPELVTREQAEYIFEKQISDELFEDLNKGLEKFGITNREDIRQFLAQCAHESGGLKWLRELGGYDYFTKNYEWRDDLGNDQEGDGAKFSGAGAIQLTGRYNYQAFANFIGDQNVVLIGVDYVAQHYPISSACFWWYKNEMSDFVASGATCRQVSARVNGWDPANGLEDRLYYYQRARDTINA